MIADPDKKLIFDEFGAATHIHGHTQTQIHTYILTYIHTNP